MEQNTKIKTSDGSISISIKTDGVTGDLLIGDRSYVLNPNNIHSELDLQDLLHAERVDVYKAVVTLLRNWTQ